MIKQMYMPEKVPVFKPEMLQELFPGRKVKTEGLVTKVNVECINGRELSDLSDMDQLLPIDIFLKRSGKGITIIITAHPEGYTAD